MKTINDGVSRQERLGLKPFPFKSLVGITLGVSILFTIIGVNYEGQKTSYFQRG